MYAAMWSEHCSYKSSKIHLRTLPTDGPAVLVGPGQDAGAVDVGRRVRRRLQDGIPFAPERDRAVPGRRDRRRRDRPGHRVDGRSPGGAAGPADVRAPGGRAEPLAPRRGRRGDRRLRQLHRGADRRRRGPVRRAAFGQPDRERAVRRDRARRPADDVRDAHAERGVADGPLRGHDRPRRDRRRLGARVGHDRGGERGIAPVRADRRSVLGEAPDRGLARAGRRGPARGVAGPRRRRPHVRRQRVRRAIRVRRAAGPRRRAAPRAGHGGVRDPHVGVAGADARDRASLEAGPGPSGVREVGSRDGGRGHAGAGWGPRRQPRRRAGREGPRALAHGEGAGVRASDAVDPRERRRPHVRAVRRRSRRRAPVAAGGAQRGVEAMGLRAVRPHGPGTDRRRARARMPPSSACRER